MFVLLFFAFIAGVVTILSPCILPLLPIILSSSVTGSKKYPWGVVTGFILSFTFFTLFLTTLVNLTGVSPDILRIFAIVIILLFGLVLVVPKLLVLFEIFASKLAAKGQKLQERNAGNGSTAGFWSGTFVGISLGLIWTPCVGPILASVISLALTGAANYQALFITLAYAVGTAIPMLAILYGGRSLIQRFPGLLRNLGKIQKVFGILMILTAVALIFNFDRKFQVYILDKFPSYGAGLTSLEENDLVQSELDKLLDREAGKIDSENLSHAPEIIPGGEWFNSEPLTLAELKGKVVLIDFWTYSCINCIRTLPYLQDWHEKYSDQGLVIIGVHTPEFEFEKNPDNLQKAILDFGLTYPIVQDNDYRTWRAYENHYWPSKYFIDHEGNLVYNHHGEGEYEQSEQLIQKLLQDAGYQPEETLVDNSYEIYSQTPETYLGYGRIERYSSPNEIKKDEMSTYEYPEKLSKNEVAFSGNWTFGESYSVGEEGSKLEINFTAKKVFLVMNPVNGSDGKVRVWLDGEERETITIDTDRLYELIDLDEPGSHVLELEFLDGNTEIYAFTFG